MIRLWNPSDSARTWSLILGILALLVLSIAPSASADDFEPLVVDSPLFDKMVETKQVDTLAYVPAEPAEPTAGPRLDLQPNFLRWPNSGAIQSRFGMRWGRPHLGIDIDGETGDPIVAAASGRVSMAENYYGYGLTVELTHSGNFAGIRTRYSHLSAMAVKVGDWVDDGELIGKMGTTGFVTGSHLHFEVHDTDGPFNPERLLIDPGEPDKG